MQTDAVRGVNQYQPDRSAFLSINEAQSEPPVFHNSLKRIAYLPGINSPFPSADSTGQIADDKKNNVRGEREPGQDLLSLNQKYAVQCREFRSGTTSPPERIYHLETGACLLPEGF